MSVSVTLALKQLLVFNLRIGSVIGIAATIHCGTV